MNKKMLETWYSLFESRLSTFELKIHFVKFMVTEFEDRANDEQNPNRDEDKCILNFFKEKQYELSRQL